MYLAQKFDCLQFRLPRGLGLLLLLFPLRPPIWSMHILLHSLSSSESSGSFWPDCTPAFSRSSSPPESQSSPSRAWSAELCCQLQPRKAQTGWNFHDSTWSRGWECGLHKQINRDLGYLALIRVFILDNLPTMIVAPSRAWPTQFSAKFMRSGANCLPTVSRDWASPPWLASLSSFPLLLFAFSVRPSYCQLPCFFGTAS